MKTITVTDQETKDTYTFPCQAYKGKKLIEVNAALARRPELQPMDLATLEMRNYLRSIEVIKAVCDAVTGPNGEVPVTEDTLLDLPPAVVAEAAFQVQRFNVTSKTDAQAEETKN